MNRRVKETSVSAFVKFVASGAYDTKKAAILELFRVHGGWLTRREVSHLMGYDTATVSGIITPLVNAGDLIETPKDCPIKCPITGNNAMGVKLNRGQLELVQ